MNQQCVLKKIFLLFTIHVFILVTSTAFAAITLISGDNQVVTVGESPTDIVFEVVDETGNPVTVGTPVTFEMVNSKGELVTGGLSTNRGLTDNSGKTLTRPNIINNLDKYTLKASVQIDTVTESVSTTLEVKAGAATLLKVAAGDGQTLAAGTASDVISFKLTDKNENAVSGEKINFSLTTPTGETSTLDLSPTNAVTDLSGQVSTSLLATATDKVGVYSITATLATDTTVTASAKITVAAGPATRLTVLSGDNQTIMANQTSDLMVLRLTDNIGNPIANKRVDFILTVPDGSTTNQGLLPSFSTSNVSGEVSTHLEASATETPGTYTIKATLAANDAVTANMTLQITEEVPDLPSLGFCGAVNTNGLPVKTTAICNGGISVKGLAFEQEATLNLIDPVLVQGTIKVDANHLEQLADLVVVAGYKPPPPDDAIEIFLMLNSLGQIQDWDLNIASLVAFRHSVTLPTTQIVNMYRGNFIAPGTLRVYFGYRLLEGPASGTVVFNASQTINIVIKKTK